MVNQERQRASAESASHDDIAALVGKRRVLVASNRGPVEFYRDPHGRINTKRGSGGVVTALAGLARSLPLTWIAATMSEGDREIFPNASTPARQVRLGRQPLRVRYVSIAPDVYARYYDEISNELLWFLQHYLWDVANSPNFTEQHYLAWDEGYCSVNHAIADAIASEVLSDPSTGTASCRNSHARDGSNAIILLQDYHLYLAAALIRERLPGAVIQQFIHIPWPDVRYWHFLPKHFLQQIYEGLAANDVLGFQTELDARNFLECARVLLPGSRVDHDQSSLIWRRHRLLAKAYPITVDAEEVRHALATAPAREAARELEPLLADDAQVIVRVDRLEPTKNIVRGFLAYEQLLRNHPELHGKVRHLAFLVPSRQSLGVYRAYERTVRSVIRRINKELGSEQWQPIKPFFDNNRARALVAMRRYDALVVNPVIDGMNLVAKEGALANEHDGVIILSRTAGASRQMADAVLPVTPTDIEETAGQLYAALVMPQHERQQMATRARNIILSESPARWIEDQLRDAAHSHAPLRASRARSLRHAG
ncbi:MAG: alpha,alpha-trehalose-phosphate synthase (UDP-forming) [Ktedonobacterales bacterium]